MIEDVATIGIAVETTGVEKGKKSLETLAQAGGRADDAMQKLGTGSKRAGADVATLAGETQKAGNAAKEAARGFESVASGFTLLKGAAAAYISLNTAQAIVKMADGVTQLNNQLRLATGSAVAAGQAYESLFQIAQKSRVSFTELGSTYAAIARAGNEMGVSQTRLLAVTQSISNAMTISGGSAQSMQAALVQLGQGLSSGTLRGEELNSIMEQTPRLAKAIADGLGVPIGALRKLGEQGELTAQQVITALEKVGPQLTKEIEGATLTVGQAFTVLGNSATKFIGTADEATGASATLASAIVSVSGALDSMGKIISENKAAFAAITAGLAGAAAIAGLVALKAALFGVAAAVGAIGIALAANPITLGIAAIAAGALALKSAADSAAKSETGLGYAIADLDQKIAASERTREAQTEAGIARLQRMRTERAKLQGELALLSVAGLDNRAEDNRLGAGVAAFKAREQVVKDFQALRQELSGVDKDFQKHLTQLKAGLDAGLITEANYVKEVEKLIAKEGGARKAGAKHTEDVYKSLREQGKAWADYIEDFQRDAAKADADLLGLTASQAKLAQMLSDPVFQQMPETWRQTALQAAYAAIAVEQQGTAQKKSVDATKAAEKAHESYIADLNKSADSVGAHIQKLQDEEAALALSATNHISLAQAIELVEIARLNEAVAVQLSYGDNTAAEAIQREIDARRELIGLIGNKEARDASKKAAEDAAKEWQRTTEQINSTLTDALMRGFESGKDFAKNMRDTVVNMFKTMVLRPVVSAVVNPVAQGINSFLYGSGGQQGAGSGGLIGNGLGAYAANNMGSLGSTVGGWFGGGATSVGASSAFAGSGFLGTTASTASGAFGVGGGMGAASGAMELAGTAATTSSAGGAAAGSSVLGAIPVWGWIALAAIAIASQAKGETRSGGQYSYDSNKGVAALLQGPSGGEISGDVVKQSIAGTAGGINGLLKGMGSSAMLVGFQAGLESSDRGRGGVFSGGTLSTGATFGESGKGNNYEGTLYEQTSSHSVDSKTALENFTTDLMQGTIQALQAAGDIPKTIADMVKGVDAESLSADVAKALIGTIEATVAGINSFRDAVDGLPFESLKDMSFDAAAGLIAAAGGMDKLGAGLSSYYDSWYTDAEKTANSTAKVSKVFTDLGLTMPDLSAGADAVRETFRAMVDGAMADTTAKGQQTTVALLGVSSALAGLVTSSASASASVANVGQSIGFDGRTVLGTADAAQYKADAGFRYMIDGLQSMADAANSWLLPGVSGGYGSPEEVASRFANTMGGGGASSGPSEEETAAKAAADAIAKASESAAKALADLATLMDGQRKESLVGGLTQLGSALYGITDAMNDAIKKATALGATEADLSVIRSNAARKTRITLAESAFATLERSVAAAGKSAALEDALGEYARNALEGMTRVAPQLSQQGITSATSKIEAALTLKKAGGTLDLASLKESIDTLAGTGTETFSTFQDYARSLSNSQNLLGQLGTTGPSIDQQMLDANNAILEQAKKQLDALHGIDNSVLLVSDAMAAFQSALAGTATPNADSLVLGGLNPALDIGLPVGSGSNDIAAMVAEIKALREALAKQQAAMESIAINTNKTAKSLTKWDVDGLPATTTAE